MYGQSPHSSSGIFGSTAGTPDTRLTAFSPDDARPSKAMNEDSNGLHSESMHHDPFVITTTKGKGEQKLSATASAFKPFALPIAQPDPAIELGFPAFSALPRQVQKLQNLINQCKSGQGSKCGNATLPPIAQIAHQSDANQHGTFSTDTGVTRCIQITSNCRSGESVHQIVVNSLELLKVNFKLTGSERSEPGVSAAYLRYSNINDASAVYSTLKGSLTQHAVEYISPAAFASVAHSPSKGSYSAHEGQVVLTASYPVGTPCNRKTFEDGLRSMLSAQGSLHAWQKLAATEAGTFRMVAEFCDSALALHAVQRLNEKNIKISQGDVIISLSLHTPDLSQSSQYLAPITTPTRRSGEQSDTGDALGGVSLTRNHTTGLQSRAEVLPTKITGPQGLPHISSDVGTLSALPAPVTGVPLMMGGIYGPAHIAFPHGYSSTFHYPYTGASDLNAAHPLTPADFCHNNSVAVQNSFDHGQNPLVGRSASGQQRFHQVSFPQQSLYQQGYGHSIGYPTQRSIGNYRDGNYFSRPSGRRQNAVRSPQHRGRQFSNPAAGHHNHVDINRIRQGIDVRTTVMLRNIPNKVDQAMLKDIVDESSFGRYDFMYLRIDFSNDCNVGYAFINFTDPLDIIDFVLARSNQKWHRFKSDKVAEVSYATIQGRDCLIQKFRNSSVMLEPPHYRPKLFLTIQDPNGRIGDEDQFPASDNASKLKRSCENAEHVGLFAPSAGQHLRDEQRRRRSQFDRGTSLAEREEYGPDDGSMHTSYRHSYY